MNSFRSLGDEILNRWRLTEFDELEFSAIAQAALADERLYHAVNFTELMNWIYSEDDPPPQAVSPYFSDAGFAVYSNNRFTIEVLTWVNASTSIHQHGFCGAFRVLLGSSLHTQFAYELKTRISERLSFGQLSRERFEQLSTGDIRPIESGSGFIHRLFHIERPSLTLVVRAHIQSSLPQYSYLEPGIAFDPFSTDPGFRSRTKASEVIQRIYAPGFDDWLVQWITQADMYWAIRIIDQDASIAARIERSPTVRGAIENCFGCHSKIVLEAVRRKHQLLSIGLLRQSITNADGRYFLGLMMNAVNRDEAMSKIAEKYPGLNAETYACDISLALDGNVGFYELDDPGRDMLHAAIRGTTFDGMCEQLAATYREEDIRELRGHLREQFELFRTGVLAPLFRV